MQSPGSPGAPSRLAVARIVRLALAASVVLYGVLTILLRGQAALAELPGAVQAALHVAAGVLVLVGVWVFRRLEAAVTRTPGAGAAVPGPALPPMMIAGWALFESVGVLGLVVSLLGGNGQVLILASLVLILLHPPRAEWFR